MADYVSDVVNQTSAVVDAIPSLATGATPALSTLEADVSYIVNYLGGGTTGVNALNNLFTANVDSWTTLAGLDFGYFRAQLNQNGYYIGFYSDVEAAFVKAYKAQILEDSGDFNSLNVQPDDYIFQFRAAWIAFTNSLPPQGVNPNAQPTPLELFSEWRKFTAKTATILESTSNNIVVNDANGSTTTPRSLPSFEGAFNAYFPSLRDKIDTATGKTFFQEALQQFYNQAISIGGYFIPSQFFGTWVNNLQEISKSLPSLSSTVLSTTPLNDSRILNDIFALLVSMIGSLQNVAAAQSNRLAIYTSWQKAYNSLLNQVHVFTATSTDLFSDGNFGLDKSTLAKRRNDVQGTFNPALTQTITSYKDVVTDDAKALQSRVNQSSDAFNEQANTATAILQQLSTILSSIFR